MLHTKFQVFQPRGSEEEDFWMLFFVYFCFKPRTHLGRVIFDPRTFIWTHLVKDYQAMSDTEFQASEASGSEEDFLIFSIYFYGLTQDTLGWGRFGPGATIWTILIKDYKPMLHNKFQAPKPSSSRENFKHISFLNPRPPRQGHFGP